MNILLTTDCNNTCKYCFIKDKSKHKYISIEDFVYCIDFANKSSDDSIYLLGGEPTLHPDFKEIVDICKEYNKKVTLLSNFIFKDLSSFLKERYTDKTINNFLINANHPSEYTTQDYELYINNLNNLPSCSNDIVLSITISDEKPIEYYSYLLDYYDKFDISRIRLSLDVNLLWNNLNNKKLGHFFYNLVRYLSEHGFLVNSELCGMQRCIFSEYEEKYLQTHLINFIISGCAPNLDIFPDLTMNYCASRPSDSAFNVNLKYFYNQAHAKSYFLSLRNLLNQEKNASCENCGFSKTCHLQCLSRFDNNLLAGDFSQKFISKDIYILPLLDYWHIFKPNSIKDYVVDEISFFILQKFFSGLEKEQIAKLLTEKYSVSYTESFNDINEIILFHT